jgi:hypothetical protein
MYDSASVSPVMSAEGFAQQAEPLLRALAPSPTPAARQPRGRPEEVSRGQLWLGLLLCLLRGLRHQRDLWRLISWEGFWHIAPTPVCDQAIYKRLAHEGLGALEQLWLGLSRLLAERLAPYAQTTLAPFAKGVFALDETILDLVARLAQRRPRLVARQDCGALRCAPAAVARLSLPTRCCRELQSACPGVAAHRRRGQLTALRSRLFQLPLVR